MKRVDRPEDVRGEMPEARVALGTFDGVHRGHRAVICEALGVARSAGGAAVVVTFEPHPQEVLAPERAPARLTSRREKDGILEALGVDFLVALPFDAGTARMEAEDFFRGMLAPLGLRTLLVGYNFRVGRGRRGNLETVTRIGNDLGFDVRIVPPVLYEGAPVSSTRIRCRVTDGRLDSAAEMLGDPYPILGTVVRGDGRGRAIGYPTANLEPEDARKLLPPDGVYAVWVRRGPGRLPGVMNIGCRPTFGGGRRTVEVHLLDLDEDLYGQALWVDVVERIRSEAPFADEARLRAGIGRDVEHARHLLDARSKIGNPR